MSDKWYNILPGVNCVFAMDYDCPVNHDGSIINYSNDTSKALRVFENRINRAYKTEFSSVKTKNYRYLLDTIYRYKALKLNDVNFQAVDPIVLPDNCTVLFVGQVRGGTVLMTRGEGRDSHHGLCKDSFNSPDYRYSWRVANLIFRDTRYNNSERDSIKEDTAIETVIIKGNKFTRSGEFITPYGSMLFSNNSYISQDVPYFSIIGYTYDGKHRPNAYIIAYGVFDKQLTQEEIDTVLKKIDEQFLVSSSSNSSVTVQKLSRYDLNLQLHTDLSNLKYIKSHNVLDGFTSIDTEYYIKDININEYGEIKDYVYEEEEPTATKLFLINRDTGQHIATTFSGDDGYFEFKNIDKDKEYLVVAPHLNYQFRAIAKDYLPRNN